MSVTRLHFRAAATLLFVSLLAFWPATLVAEENTNLNDPDIPSSAPNDAVMATSAEIEQMHAWTQKVFARTPSSGFRLTLVRQDYNCLRLGRSVMGTPLKLGEKTYQHGLGTHANSEIEVLLPADAAKFEALCGIDNNYDTRTTRGSAAFSIDIDGKEAFRSSVLKGSDQPTSVNLAIPAGARKLSLKVDASPDGLAFDQSDWADARLTMKDGSTLWLDKCPLPCLLREDAAPFSFLLDGARPDFLAWKHQAATLPCPDGAETTATWTDPKTALKVTAVARTYTRFPAVDWTLCLENTGDKDSPIIENLQAVDAALNLGGNDCAATLHRLEGDYCNERNFRPIDEPLAPKGSIRLSPQGGRSSQTTGFPFFDFENGQQGLVAAVGWTGQWAATLSRDENGQGRLQAGMERTRLRLHPGEKIRTPRVVLMTYSGERTDALNRWRRLLLFHYTPQANGRPAVVPVASQCFDRYSTKVAQWATEKGQMQAAEVAARMGCDTHWFDAAWFPGEFPNGVGNWMPKPAAFPRGLAPVGELCRKLGLRFLVWFEPERVARDTEIATNHPEWVFGGTKGGLFKLNEPEARRWMTDLISQRITQFGLDVYRQDFNMDPLESWRANDAPDRQGMTEIRYVEGLYAMWDELLRRHPGLLIDNCASGGRRLDIEMLSRSIPLWRSDTGCGVGNEDLAQAQTFGLSRYLPIHSTCSWLPGAYSMRSAATAGIAVQFDYLAKDFAVDEARAAVTEAKANRPFWYGDYYPLTPCGTAPEEFVAYQFHRPDLDAGIVLAFRRRNAPTLGLIVAPCAIKPDVRYAVEFVDEARHQTTQTLTGKQILSDGLDLRIPARGASLLIHYRRE